jgi:hypothetical protein
MLPPQLEERFLTFQKRHIFSKPSSVLVADPNPPLLNVRNRAASEEPLMAISRESLLDPSTAIPMVLDNSWSTSNLDELDLSEDFAGTARVPLQDLNLLSVSNDTPALSSSSQLVSYTFDGLSLARGLGYRFCTSLSSQLCPHP